ncbi:MAG TPA: hypothetical protein ENN03_11690 [bacterium]|nr:hypothetical protein [bacterium]
MNILSFFRRCKLVLAVVLLCGFGHLPGQEGDWSNQEMGYCFDAAFHPEQERLFVAAGSKGLHVFNVQSGHLDFVTTFYDEGYYRNIDITQDRAFIADARRGLVTLDISGEIPVVTWRWKEPETKTPGMGIHVNGSHAYLAVGNANGYNRPGVYIFDISRPDSPEPVGYANTKNAWDVWVKDTVAFVADMSEGLTVLDLSDPSSPRTISNARWDEENSMAEIIRGEGSKVYIAAGKHGLIIVDIHDPFNPEVEGKFRSGPQGFAEGLHVRNQIVFLANGHQILTRENGLFVIDAGNPKDPKLLGKHTFPDWVEGVCLRNNVLFITNTYSGVRSVDISNLSEPTIIDHFGPVQTKLSIAEKILTIIEDQGLEAAVTRYRKLKEHEQAAYEFDEKELNRLGYYLLKTRKIDEAIRIFELNQEVFPRSENTFDSLGDAYLYKAYWYYNKSLELNPDNEHAKSMIQRISGK